MRHLALLFFLAASTLVKGQDFTGSFRAAFSQSIKGLDAARGAADGEAFVSTMTLPGFSDNRIVRDASLGVQALRCSKWISDETAAKEALAQLEKDLVAALPAGEYVRSQSYGPAYVGYMKTLYEFNSAKMADKQKRPSVECGLIQVGDRYELVVLLYEPYFKNQYTPKF